MHYNKGGYKERFGNSINLKLKDIYSNTSAFDEVRCNKIIEALNNHESIRK